MNWDNLTDQKLIELLRATRRLIALMVDFDAESPLWDELNQRYCALELEARFRGLDKRPDSYPKMSAFKKFIETLNFDNDDETSI